MDTADKHVTVNSLACRYLLSRPEKTGEGLGSVTSTIHAYL